MKRNQVAVLFVMVVTMAAFAQSSHEKSAKGGGAEQALKDLEIPYLLHNVARRSAGREGFTVSG